MTFKTTKRLAQIEKDLKELRKAKKTACCHLMEEDHDSDIYFLMKERRELKSKSL